MTTPLSSGSRAADVNTAAFQSDAKLARKRAELMQDILIHDIKNYNQVILANAELLAANVMEEDLRHSANLILEAVNGSTALVVRARQLGNIMSENEPPLFPTSLSESFSRSLSLIRLANPGRNIGVESYLQSSQAWVMADDMLDEVFINILSNAVKYTKAEKVVLSVTLEEMASRGDGTTSPAVNEVENRYWKLTITDSGSGIPDCDKGSVTTRYLGSARGKGLGLSITRALVVDRYGGRLEIRNRVKGDYRMGTSVVVSLPTVLH
jgi:signal transduction histidine kinase